MQTQRANANTKITNNTNPETHQPAHHPDADAVGRALAKRSFATLATTSPAGRPHVAGVLYVAVDDVLYINTIRSSHKARNIAANPYVAVTVPIRRVPVGPPSSVLLQSEAELLDVDSPEITRLVETGRLKALTKHGELDLPDSCFIRIPLPRRLHTYGLGMPLLDLIRDPLSAGGVVNRDAGS